MFELAAAVAAEDYLFELAIDDRAFCDDAGYVDEFVEMGVAEVAELVLDGQVFDLYEDLRVDFLEAGVAPAGDMVGDGV